MWKYLHNDAKKVHTKKEGVVSVTAVDAAVSGRRCLFLCESKSTLFGLPNEDLESLVKICIQQNSTIQMFEFVQRICFVNGQYKAGCAQRLFKKYNKFDRFDLCRVQMQSFLKVPFKESPFTRPPFLQCL